MTICTAASISLPMKILTCPLCPAGAGRSFQRWTENWSPGVTDRDYYTNSFHVPVNYGISIFDKITREGQFHAYCNAGHISYVELEAPPLNNLEALDKILHHMADSDVGYGGVNFPIDECRSCYYSGIIADRCPRCDSSDIRRIRRITGYLSTSDRFNAAKFSELRDRRPHFTPRELEQ